MNLDETQQTIVISLNSLIHVKHDHCYHTLLAPKYATEHHNGLPE
jgi:hypothetical protein